MADDYWMSLQTLETVMWAVGGTSIALSLGRYYIRWTSCGFLADDVAHLFAIIFMVAKFSLSTATTPMLQAYQDYWTAKFENLPGPLQVEPVTFQTVEGVLMTDSLLGFLSIWAVKFAFVLLYRTICGVSMPLKIMWWSTLLFNIATLGLCAGSVFSICGGSPTHLFDPQSCGDAQHQGLVNILTASITAAVVSSDFVTMLLPLAAMCKLKMRISHRIAVLVAMSVSGLSILFEVLRYTREGFMTEDGYWSTLEIGVAVVVSTLPAYYSLIARAYERHFPTSRKFSPPDGKFNESFSSSSPV